jgi:hypothetical protein
MPAPVIAHSIERYFQVSLFLLVGAGFAALATTGQLDPATLILVTAALAVRGGLLVQNREIGIPEAWTSGITLAYVLFYLVDYSLLSAGFVKATVHLVLFAMVVKIFSVRRDRDYLYLAILAFLELLAACVLTVDTLFLAAFALFAVLAVNTFVSLEMRRSAAKAELWARDAAKEQRRFSRQLFAFATVLVVGIAAGSAVLFFVLPRTTAGYLNAFAPVNQVASGFNNEVNLGRIGQIQQLDTVVLYVQFFGANLPAGELKLRGLSLGLFDGHRWSNPPLDTEVLPPVFGRFDFAPLYRHWNDPLAPPGHRAVQVVRYRVLMEPIGSDVFFLAPKPESLLGSYHEVGADAAGAFYNTDRTRTIDSYEAISVAEHPSAAELRAAGTDYPPGIELQYLQLPDRLDPRMRTLAEQVTAGASTPYDKAKALEDYLSSHYLYTLQLPAQTPRDPIADFLFERKRGHCEFFASAMTIMLRSLGMPARLVNGFRGSDFNRMTGRYVVRARHAHTWVESYFPGFGWMAFDPTPVAPDADAGGFWSNLRLYLDTGREFWREWIVEYDFSHQRALTFSAVSQGRVTANRLRRELERHYAALLAAARHSLDQLRSTWPRWAEGLGALVGLLVAVLHLGRWRRALAEIRLARRPARDPQPAATVWYLRLLSLLARRGWGKTPAQTPAEFLNKIEDPTLQSLVADFTDHYQRARFGASAPDAARLPELFVRVKAKRQANGRGHACKRS